MWRDKLREHGFTAHRGAQHSGSPDSPDVVCDELRDKIHFEVKFVEKLNLRDAVEQAQRDSADTGKAPVVAHKRSNSPWLVTMPADDFLELIKEAL